MWVVRCRIQGKAIAEVIATYKSEIEAYRWCNTINSDGWWDVTYYVEEVKDESA